jgi:hypothetical protein
MLFTLMPGSIIQRYKRIMPRGKYNRVSSISLFLVRSLRSQNRGGKKQRDNRGWNDNGRGPAREIERENERLESYYNDLEIVPKEEREEFWTAMRRDLPNSFRFTGSKGYVSV